jgi:hypothetical protein
MLSKAALARLVWNANDDGVVSWRTPTSIFIGLSPVKLARGCPFDEKGPFATVRVFNPVEHRHQQEKLREGKVIGVVLRGGRIYGWASQPYHLEHKKGEYRFQPSAGRHPPSHAPGSDIRRCVQRLSSLLLLEATFPRSRRRRIQPLFDQAHIEQLRDITANIDNRVVRAVNTALRRQKGADACRVVARMYGGGRIRKAMTFQHLYETYHIREVPEQWGDGTVTYSPETASMLIGSELGADGALYYLRLHEKDVVR